MYDGPFTWKNGKLVPLTEELKAEARAIADEEYRQQKLLPGPKYLTLAEYRARRKEFRTPIIWKEIRRDFIIAQISTTVPICVLIVMGIFNPTWWFLLALMFVGWFFHMIFHLND